MNHENILALVKQLNHLEERAAREDYIVKNGADKETREMAFMDLRRILARIDGMVTAACLLGVKLSRTRTDGKIVYSAIG